jgi:hypothetical protein
VVLEKIFAVVQLTKLTRQNGILTSVIQPVANISCTAEHKKQGVDEDGTLFDVVEAKFDVKDNESVRLRRNRKWKNTRVPP